MTILALPRPSMCQITREDILQDLEEYKRREVTLCLETMRLRAQLSVYRNSYGEKALQLRQIIQEKESALDMCRELQRCIRVELGLHDDA